jgi:hypothetical protein
LIENRINQIQNNTGLTKLSDKVKNTVRLTDGLTDKQKMLVLDALNKLERTWKVKDEDRNSRFKLDDDNTSNIISKLLSTQELIKAIEIKKEKNPSYTVNISDLVRTLGDTTGRINSGLKAELPTITKEKPLVTV